MNAPNVVTPSEWLEERKKLLKREKELTRLRDDVARERRALPAVEVTKAYEFDGPRGKSKLADLFAGRSQLVIYHFMFGPDWAEGCPSCSFVGDHLDGAVVHLGHRDVTLAAVSRAPYAKIAKFRQRMGWRFDWVSSHGSDFNFDFHVSYTPEQIASGAVEYNYATVSFPFDEAHGLSVFRKDDEGRVYHTYSSYGRGCESLLTTYSILDLVPKGRDEEGLAFSMAWLRHHDRYDAKYQVDPRVGYEVKRDAVKA